jgi:hypothetical protein
MQIAGLGGPRSSEITSHSPFATHAAGAGFHLLPVVPIVVLRECGSQMPILMELSTPGS